MEEVAPRLGFRLVRIEVAAEALIDDPGDLWAAWASDDDDNDTVVLGYLRASSPSGFGQARGAAVIVGRSFASCEDAATFEEWIRENVLEHLYDTCRRAINAQAAAMDVTIEIPTKAPNVELQRISEPDPSTEGSVVVE